MRQPTLEEIREAAAKYGYSLNTVSGCEAAERKVYEAINLSTSNNEEQKPKRQPTIEEIQKAAERLGLSLSNVHDVETAEKAAADSVDLTTQVPESQHRVTFATESKTLRGNGHISINLYGEGKNNV